MAGLRRRLGALRWRLAPPSSAKGDGELRWWLDVWERRLREETTPETYLQRRWADARAEVARVLGEAAIEDDGFFAGKVVLDIGSGPVGLPDALSEIAARSYSVDPLADRYRRAGLLLDSAAEYLACGAEAIPLGSSSIDVVVSRNNLDHVDDPQAVVTEVKRLLRPGGTFILNTDVDHTPTPSEPHSLSIAQLRDWLAPLEIRREDHWDHPHGHDGHAVVIVAVSR